ncbi:hypothetical protein EHYA_09357 [Embleya hyalina]|uniref:Uncharacterized protein n=1 Tax=Embleya hyalina TaxID=516124 RepID=A0A401Z415_9ACTN|nr:hypothetical protein EHYA_09357 [Embleya hyalina]
MNAAGRLACLDATNVEALKVLETQSGHLCEPARSILESVPTPRGSVEPTPAIDTEGNRR